MSKQHHYKLAVKWTGNKGTGTSNYTAYERSHSIEVDNKIEILGSVIGFCGDKTKHNPEELLVAAVSSCHMLWYLHLCAEAGVIVIGYIDNATGIMIETENGSGKFTAITLHPIVTISNGAMTEKATALHHKANELCYIANSLNFPVYHQPTCKVANE